VTTEQVATWFAIIRVVKRNRAFKIASRIQNPNFTRPKARSRCRIGNCLIFLQEKRLNARRFKNLVAFN
jgi:hypothetical protein